MEALFERSPKKNNTGKPLLYELYYYCLFINNYSSFRSLLSSVIIIIDVILVNKVFYPVVRILKCCVVLSVFQRCISVYSVEHATLGVGKIYLTKEEREKANEIWRLVKQEGDEYKKFSRNEIEEMVLVNKLDPSLEELWKKRESLLEEDIKEKCKISDEKDISIPSEQ